MKHWLLPISGALALHTAFFVFDFGVTRPIVMIPESKAVTISLVAVPPAPVIAKPSAPPIPRPLKKHLVTVPKLKPTIAPEPLPPVPTPVEPAPIEPEIPVPAPLEQGLVAPDETATASAEASEPDQSSSDQAQIKASVPLYHLNPPPTYPAVAQRRNYQGTAFLEVLVDHRGRAAQVKVHQSSGFSVLDRSALKSVRQWRFEPARRMGRAVEMWVRVPVKFELK